MKGINVFCPSGRQPRNLTGIFDKKGRPEGQPKDNTCGFPDYRSGYRSVM